MNQSNETVHDRDAVGEELMAYLDGELDVESRRELEDRLSTSAELRQRVKELQQTWDLLEELPREQVDDAFTRLTVEMVAVQSEEESQRRARQREQWRVLSLGLGFTAALAAGFVGFALTTFSLTEPNRRLIEDLPLLQNLDAYHNAGSIEFLRMLDRAELFREDDTDAN